MKQRIPLGGLNVTERRRSGEGRGSCPGRIWNGAVGVSMFQGCKEITTTVGENIWVEVGEKETVFMDRVEMLGGGDFLVMRNMGFLMGLKGSVINQRRTHSRGT
jgi:hypothetical protein